MSTPLPNSNILIFELEGRVLGIRIFLKLPEWFKCVTVDGDHCSTRSDISTCIRKAWNALKVEEYCIRSRAPALEFCVWGEGIWIFPPKLLRFPYAHSSWRSTRLEHWRHKEGFGQNLWLRWKLLWHPITLARCQVEGNNGWACGNELRKL